MLNITDIEIIHSIILLILLLWVLSLYLKVKALRHKVIGLTSRMVDTPAVDETLIRLWRKQYEELPEGSAKWNAYRTRLLESGVSLGGD